LLKAWVRVRKTYLPEFEHIDNCRLGLYLNGIKSNDNIHKHDILIKLEQQGAVVSVLGWRWVRILFDIPHDF
jgi:hypothetical protein